MSMPVRSLVDLRSWHTSLSYTLMRSCSPAAAHTPGRCSTAPSALGPPACTSRAHLSAPADVAADASPVCVEVCVLLLLGAATGTRASRFGLSAQLRLPRHRCSCDACAWECVHASRTMGAWLCWTGGRCVAGRVDRECIRQNMQQGGLTAGSAFVNMYARACCMCEGALLSRTGFRCTYVVCCMNCVCVYVHTHVREGRAGQALPGPFP